jgi:S-adenosylmethionine synthetase
MKVLVAGASGLVGRNLITELRHREIEYVATYNSRPVEGGHRVNFEDEYAIREFFQTQKPTVCVNCIVQRLTDVCEKNWDETKRVNIDLVDRLARICAELNVHLIHISTDYVFDGKAPPYKPNCVPNPLQNYGMSKLIAEYRVKANCPGTSAILRVPVLYCDQVENLEENAVTLIGKKVLNQVKPTTEDNYSIRRPVYIPDFCVFIADMCDTQRSGVFHYSNPNDAVTKWEMAKMIGAYLEKPTDHILPASTTGSLANRPWDTQLLDPAVKGYKNLWLKEGIARSFAKFKHPKEFGSDCLVLFDLDGTLLDTDRIQYEAYRLAMEERGMEFSWEEFERGIQFAGLEQVLRERGLSDSELQILRERKLWFLQTLRDIHPFAGAEEFIRKLAGNGTNMVVVTNTTRKATEHFRECLPFLKLIPNWVCREDCSKPKPDPESFQKAVELYGKGETYRIGFENTVNGFKALRAVVPCIYFMTDPLSVAYKTMEKEDVFLIRNFQHFSL